MPPYRASGLGGINGSGVYMPDTRPIIDVGSIIDSASRAFANTREGVLHRALLQQAANREDQQHQLRVAEAAGQGIMPIEAARRMVDQGGFEEDTTPDTAQPAAAPATAPEVPAATAPPPLDSSLEGAPGATTTAPQLVAPVPAQGAAPPAKPKKSKYTMIDLGNGFAQIPELSPFSQRTAMLEQRLKEMAAAIPARGEQARETAAVNIAGRSGIETQRETATTARDVTKHGFDMEKQAAANAAHLEVARIRGSMKADPSTMTPQARVNMLGKLADTYVAASQGDPDKAVEMADADPTLSSFGTNPKQLQSFIGASVGKWQRGELNTNLRTQGQTFETPEQTTARIAATKKVVAGENSDPTAGMSDADAWEHWRTTGLTPAQATAKVNGRKK